MKILVCVKQVPEAGAQVGIDDESGWVRIGTGAEYGMNRFDECAVEEAVRIKEALPDTVIDVVTVGPARAESVVRRAMGMGADNGAHILTSANGYLDAFETANAIARYAGDKAYDLVLAGAMSEDLMQGQVGPLVAGLLGTACVTGTVKISLSAGSGRVYVEREVEGGLREAGEMTLPVLLTIQTGINTPRYPALSKLLRANSRELEVLDLDAFERNPPVQHLVGVSLPEKTRDALYLEGSTVDKATRLLKILRERSLMP